MLYNYHTYLRWRGLVPIEEARRPNIPPTSISNLHRNVDILREFCDFEFSAAPFPEEKKKIDIGDYYADFSKFRSHTGWSPKTGLRDGLKQTIEFYREHGGHYWE